MSNVTVIAVGAENVHPAFHVIMSMSVSPHVVVAAAVASHF